MEKKLRIYYESIEQGANCIKPIIEEALKGIKSNIEIELIKLEKKFYYYSKRVAPIIFWKEPDILITAIIDEVEYPLLLIEFSTAVYTEDHELQRFDGLVAAAENNCIYVKISPVNKQSQSRHGGNINFDYLIPFSLILKKFGKLFYHFNWKCNNEGILEINEKYLSCPNELVDFNNLLKHLVKYVVKGSFDPVHWIERFEESILSFSYFKSWKEELESCKIPDVKSLNSTRIEWIDSTKELVLKLNRFGHAMDPERGMLSFYGNLYDKTVSKMLFDEGKKAWYKDTPNEKEIEKYIREHGLKKGYDYLYCFMLGSGLYKNKDFEQIVLGYKNNTNAKIDVDLTDFLKKNYLTLSKPMRTIFKYSSYFYIVDVKNNIKVKFFWKDFDKNESYTNFPNVTNITKKEYFDEDDVTYIMVHNVLKQNNYVILAVSYPGAQGDRVVLIAPGTGRAQDRRYVDIISYLPDKCTNLQEDKGIFSVDKIQEDIDELTKYKTENEYIQAISSFIDRFDKAAPKIINIGIGFWANSNFSLSTLKKIDLKDLDYYVYLTPDRKKWYIWSTGKRDIFIKWSGDIEIPQVFSIIKNK
jgi:hypothetical protein